MTLDRRALLTLAAAAIAAPAAALAGDKAIPARKLFPYLDVYLDLAPAERTRFVMAYYLRKAGRPATGVGLTLMSAGRRTPLPVGPDGRIQHLPTLAELKDGEVALTKANPADKLQLSLEIQARVALGETVPAGDLVAAIDQCNAAIRRKAGVIGLVAPKMEQVVFPNGAGSVVLAGGRTVAMPTLSEGAAFKPASHPGAQMLRFTRIPGRALLD